MSQEWISSPSGNRTVDGQTSRSNIIVIKLKP